MFFFPKKLLRIWLHQVKLENETDTKPARRYISYREMSKYVVPCQPNHLRWRSQLTLTLEFTVFFLMGEHILYHLHLLRNTKDSSQKKKNTKYIISTIYFWEKKHPSENKNIIRCNMAMDSRMLATTICLYCPTFCR